MAFGCESQQAFLEGHVRAFEWFGGVFETLRYDNLGSAVTQVCKGRRRVECDRFVALRSHYLFESVFCLPGKRGAHEKGGVEGEVGRFRRRHLVPVPKVASIACSTSTWRRQCWTDLDRTIVGRSEPGGEALERERRLLGDLPREAHCTAQEATPRVDSKAMVAVRGNRYSVPASMAGRRVRAQIGANTIDIWHEGQIVASHERLAGKHETSTQLDHYLDLLERKPGALERSLALRQERDRGDWPECFDELWEKITERSGRARRPPDRWSMC
jgi:hypothetical protein